MNKALNYYISYFGIQSEESDYKKIRSVGTTTFWLNSDGTKLIKIRDVKNINEFEKEIYETIRLPYIITPNHVCSFPSSFEKTIVIQEFDYINKDTMDIWLMKNEDLNKIKAIIFKVFCFISALHSNTSYIHNNVIVSNIIIDDNVTEHIKNEDKVYRIIESPSIKLSEFDNSKRGDVRSDMIHFINSIISTLFKYKSPLTLDIMKFALDIFPNKMKAYIRDKIDHPDSINNIFRDPIWTANLKPINRDKSQIIFDLNNINSPGECKYPFELLEHNFFNDIKIQSI